MSVFYYNSGAKQFTFGASTTGTRTARIETVSVSEAKEYADGGVTPIGTMLTFTITGWIVGSSETDLKNRIRLARESLNESRAYLEYQHQDNVPSYSYTPGITASEGNTPNPSSVPSRGTPKPTRLDFKRFAGDTTVQIEFQAEVFVTTPLNGPAESSGSSGDGFMLPGSGTTGSGNYDEGIKALWYDTRVTYDENYTPQVVVAGTFEVDENFEREKISVYIDNKFPRAKGWKRAPVEYQWSSTGYTVEFAFTDKMIKRAFPPPITSGRAQVKLSSNRSRTVKTLNVHVG